jgi:hypothetical protein
MNGAYQNAKAKGIVITKGKWSNGVAEQLGEGLPTNPGPHHSSNSSLDSVRLHVGQERPKEVLERAQLQREGDIAAVTEKRHFKDMQELRPRRVIDPLGISATSITHILRLDA